MRVGAGIRQLLAEMRFAPSIVAALVAMSAVAAFLVAVVPLLRVEVSRDDLRSALDEASPIERNIEVDVRRRFGAAFEGDPFTFVRNNAQRVIDEEFPESIVDVVADTRYVFDSPSFRVTSFPSDRAGPFRRWFTFRHLEGIEDHTTVVEGRQPGAGTTVPTLLGHDCPDAIFAVDDFEIDPEGEPIDCRIGQLPVHETAVTRQTADDLMVDTGDRLVLRLDDAAFPRLPVMVVEIVGILELTDGDDPYWYSDLSLHRPVVTETADFRIINAVGLMAPDQYRAFLSDVQRGDMRYRFRYLVDTDAVTAADLGLVAADVDKIAPRRAVVSTRLPEMLSAHRARARATTQLVSTAVAGVGVLGLSALALLALLGAERLHSTTVLLRSRGSSTVQLVGREIRRGFALVVPAAAVGLGAAGRVVPGVAMTTSIQVVGALAVVAVLLVVLAAAPAITTRPVGENGDRSWRSGRSRRLVVELFLVLLAAAAVVLLRRRGGLDGDTELDRDLDLLLSFGPALVAIAAGIVGLRLLDLARRALGRLARGARGVVPFVAARRVHTASVGGRLPVIVLVIGVAIAVFASGVRSSVAAGQVDHGWQITGADHRIEGHRPGAALPTGFDVADSPLTAWAAGIEFPAATIVTSESVRGVDVLAVEVDTLVEILDGSVEGRTALVALSEASRSAPGAPALVSTDWPRGEAPGPGTTARLQIPGSDVDVEVLLNVDTLPGRPPDRPFIVLPLDDLRAAEEGAARRPTVLYGAGDAGAFGQLRGQLHAADPTSRLVSRYAVAAAVRRPVLTTWATRGLGALVPLATGFCAGAAVAWLALTAAARRRDVGLLATLGMTSRQALRLVVAEVTPILTIAVGVGVLSGIATTNLLGPALDLEAFTGEVTTTVSIDAGEQLAVVAVILVAVTLAVSALVRTQSESITRAIVRVGGTAE